MFELAAQKQELVFEQGETQADNRLERVCVYVIACGRKVIATENEE